MAREPDLSEQILVLWCYAIAGVLSLAILAMNSATSVVYLAVCVYFLFGLFLITAVCRKPTARGLASSSPLQY